MKKLFTFLLLSLALTLQAADKVWCMVTDDGTKIALSRIAVGCIQHRVQRW